MTKHFGCYFKTHHFDVTATDEKDNEAHAAEQTVIDKQDKEVDALTVRLETLLAVLTSPDISEKLKLLLRRLRHIKKTLYSTTEAIDGLSSDLDDPAMIQAYEEELSSLKEQIALCYNYLCGHKLGEKDEMLDLYTCRDKENPV